MKRVLRAGLTILLVLVLVLGVGRLVFRMIHSAQNEQSNLEAQEMIELPDVTPPLAEVPVLPPEEQGPEPAVEPEPPFDDPYARTLLDVDLAALQTVNADVLGWISIPDTPISYPLLQGEDNDYYLNHTWKKEYNSGGSIFMECWNNADFSSFNTIIYGHRMSDSSMFNSLRHYDDPEYLEQHPRIYIAAEDGVRVYEVFAACEVTVTDPVYWLITTQEKYKQPMIDFCLERSVLDTGITPTPEDRLITLSTCVSMAVTDERWVVIGAELGMIPR